jgi:hypothetical protein
MRLVDFEGICNELSRLRWRNMGMRIRHLADGRQEQPGRATRGKASHAITTGSAIFARNVEIR